jgi:hypothetical protein
MGEIFLTVMGAGNVRCSPPVLASLATYFGERPLAIRLSDADAERLDVFDRLARLFFRETQSVHSLIATDDPAEALHGAGMVILQMDENCASKYLSRDEGGVQSALDRMQDAFADDAAVLSLQSPTVRLERRVWEVPDWPAQLEPDDDFAMRYQVLRWLQGEEYVTTYLIEHERSPLRRWLDDPTTARL